MGDVETAPSGPALEVLHTVRCLRCGAVYAKPAQGGTGGTVTANPGCPDRGYVGWLATSSATALALRHRFAVDRRRRHSA